MIDKNKNQLVAYDPYKKIANVDAFVRATGRDIARSRLFGCESEEQGNVLALECYATRTPPLSLAKRFDLIGGRLSMKADAMLADFVADGGQYDIVEYSTEACEIIFRYANHALPLRITWEAAQKENWPFGKADKSGNRALKTGWSTPIGRQDMLWARVISRGVRRVAPHIVAGRYTPDELADFVETPEQVAGEVIDASFEIVAGESPTGDELLTQSTPVEDTRDEAPDGGATPAQTEAIRRLYEVLSVPLAKQEEILAKRNVNALRSLTAKQADELIAKLQQMVDASQVPPEATSVEVDGPVDQALIDQIKEQIGIAVQTGMPGMADDVKRMLAECGAMRLAGLTVRQGQVMLKAVTARNLQIWATSALKQPSVKFDVNPPA